MLTLENRHLRFTFDPNTGYWGLAPAGEVAPRLESARVGGIYTAEAGGDRGERRTVYWDGELIEAHAEESRQADSAHGPLRMLSVEARTSATAAEALSARLVFALPEQHPLLIWRMVVTNTGPSPIWLKLLDLLRVGPRFQPRSGRSGMGFRLRSLFRRELDESPHPAGPAGALVLPPTAAPRLAFFSNGYQSWSFAGALQAHDHQPSSIFGPLGDPKAVNLVTPRFRRAGRFSSDMFGVLADSASDSGVLAGVLAQREQFSAVDVMLDPSAPSLRLTAQCDDVRRGPGEARATDWACLQFVPPSHPDPLADYAGAVARENNARVPAHTPVGWCSWYHFFDKVTEQDMVDNLDAIVAARDRLPLDFVQLDDGFQAQVGDWFETKPAFPHGLAWLAGKIREHGHGPGLWLAPYMVRSDARLPREHPDWFLRAPDGRLANAGFNWLRWCYGLDPTHPAVRDHVRRLITTAVQEWGFRYLKLDFLYAASLPAKRYDPALTRAQAMRLALEDIRAAAGPGTFLLGCGCPLGSAIGVVDGMRISTDVAPDWDPRLFTPYLDRLLYREMDFVGVRNAIRNTINRAPLHRRWWLNDPDCLVVRDHDTHLTEPEVRSLASVIALSGGMFLVSDDMPRLSPERQRYVAALLPVLGASARAVGWLDHDMPDLFVLPWSGPAGEWVIAGVFNWSATAAGRDVPLPALGLDPAHEHYAAEFWDESDWVVEPGAPLRLQSIPPHGVRLVALRARRPAEPQLVGSSFHFSQGAEVSVWRASQCGVELVVDLGRQATGQLRLALPAPPATARAEGRPAPTRHLGQGIYAISLDVNRSSTLTVEW